MGPQLLRDHGLSNLLTSLGWDVEDTTPDVCIENLMVRQQRPPTLDPPNARNCTLVGHGAQLLADRVETTMNQGHFPVILGGDHSIAVGSLAGILRARPDTGM